MKELWLVRHGHKQEGHFYDAELKVQDPPLSGTGIKQARFLARRLQKIHFDAVYTSDLTRTRRTAQILNRKIKSTLSFTPALREINFGEAEPLSPEQVEQRFPNLFSSYYTMEQDIPYPGGETGAAVLKRLLPFINPLLEREFTRCLLVTHGGTIRVFLSHILGMDQGKRFRLGDPPLECSVSIIKYYPENNRMALDLFNSTGRVE